MLWTARSRSLLFTAAALLLFNVGRQTWRWLVFGDEREALRRLGPRVEEAALAVMRSQLEADSLRRAIEGLDGELQLERAELTVVERRADARGLPGGVYEEYRSGLKRYNERVAARNQGYDRWRQVIGTNHAAVDAYNLLADSIRRIGVKMGEPYLDIVTPAEAALRNGVKPPAPRQ